MFSLHILIPFFFPNPASVTAISRFCAAPGESVITEEEGDGTFWPQWRKADAAQGEFSSCCSTEAAGEEEEGSN